MLQVQKSRSLLGATTQKFLASQITRNFSYGKKIRIELDLGKTGAKKTIYAESETNLMQLLSSTMSISTQNFGKCNGEMKCATCAVHMNNKYESVPQPQKRELVMLKNKIEDYKTNRTRLSCQVVLTTALDGLQLGIPEETVKKLVSEKSPILEKQDS